MDDRTKVCQLRLDEFEAALDKVLAAGDQRARPLVPFEGTWQGRPVVVTAVLQQTVVLYPADTLGAPDDRQVVRRPEVLVHPGRLRWKEARPTRPGDGFVLQVQGRPRRCSDCRRTPTETEFRAYKAAYCVECSRRQRPDVNARTEAQPGLRREPLLVPLAQFRLELAQERMDQTREVLGQEAKDVAVARVRREPAVLPDSDEPGPGEGGLQYLLDFRVEHGLPAAGAIAELLGIDHQDSSIGGQGLSGLRVTGNGACGTHWSRNVTTEGMPRNVVFRTLRAIRGGQLLFQPGSRPSARPQHGLGQLSEIDVN